MDEPTQAQRILLVEDDPSYAEVLETWLRQRFHGPTQLITRRSLQEALAVLDERPVDVILLDLGLPDSSELATLRRIQARSPETPTVVVTGLPEAHLALAAIRAGAEDYLPKVGLTPERLEQAIRYAILRHVRHAALFKTLETVTARLQQVEEVGDGTDP
jgi:HTH-type transcriptional regulator, bacterioopsin transcriptional activator and related proteins